MSQTPLTREEAQKLVGTVINEGTRDEGTVIGVDNKPGRDYPDGIYLIISHPNKPASYKKVG